MAVSVFCNQVKVGDLQIWAQGLKETYCFTYTSSWLEKGFALDPQLPLSEYPCTDTTLWGCFQDISPDRWGRLVQRRKNKGLLSESQYMLGTSDYFRMGALRLHTEGKFVADTTDIPKLVHLNALSEASARLEQGEACDKDIKQLLSPSGSLGGARPKAGVEKQGALYIAKFPSIKDKDSQIPECEQTMLFLAHLAGINVCESHLHHIGDQAILLVKRFDRISTDRIPYMSAMTLLEAKDGETHNYCELSQKLSIPDRQELFRRMVFNGLFGNCDDHLRNHGLLYQNGKWALSPAFDITPTPTDWHKQQHALLFAPGEPLPSLDLFNQIKEYFNVDHTMFATILSAMLVAQENFEPIARKNGINRNNLSELEHNYAHAEFGKIQNYLGVLKAKKQTQTTAKSSQSRPLTL
ncbi:type II toxin-antitoxin system HipA family toxin [Helicobacter felis]|uniref:type II toxin-antitoxin system HipA family toxin n=1 Tax=Helicobacter felis TaxID=214 RepID=UPI000EF727E0|nr:type II toxin-antitoxin system HipA family toxin [Helicobacter felis]